ncbi:MULTISPECIES: signal peptidase I [Bacillota]|jgi:signal peptidase I|uniref:Signal peptidase I n=2 Tax=Amedibacillus TaxID=2749846 RepID=A0A7G9GLM8_9FIRM|nr:MULTISPECIES: signal peptidase I [Bacillota]QNM11710.1 signal peptidase I [[Eubacterium] hominis]MCH4285041.1 signal peptidase I [Amedibacillus hominis]RGB56073.1 signal peptidase I [Absiella sp. AM22-9]RGB61834.1 signal peptidase I [Absiella sp. AM10-20]RGB70345.1 signal peptidase I [Absiella sp. AM09-45]
MKNRKEKKQRDRLDILLTICDYARVFVIAILISLLVFTFGVRKKVVSGNSMYPILQDKEDVLINVAASYLTSIDRFDVVVVKNENEEHDLWVKRVIGLPGETIAYKDGKLYVNHQVVEETFLDTTYMEKAMKEKSLSVFTQDMEEITLQKDEYFLAGDNRVNSLDSRTPSVGPFHRNQIIAKGVLVYSPLSKVRYISDGK